MSVRPGADVRIDPDLPKLLKQGKVLTLADQANTYYLNCPAKLLPAIEFIVKALTKQGSKGIHLEANRGIIRKPDVMRDFIEAGGLLQITAASLTGNFGSSCQEIAELAVDEDLSTLSPVTHMTQNIDPWYARRL